MTPKLGTFEPKRVTSALVMLEEQLNLLQHAAQEFFENDEKHHQQFRNLVPAINRIARERAHGSEDGARAAYDTVDMLLWDVDQAMARAADDDEMRMIRAVRDFATVALQLVTADNDIILNDRSLETLRKEAMQERNYQHYPH